MQYQKFAQWFLKNKKLLQIEEDKAPFAGANCHSWTLDGIPESPSLHRLQQAQLCEDCPNHMQNRFSEVHCPLETLMPKSNFDNVVMGGSSCCHNAIPDDDPLRTA